MAVFHWLQVLSWPVIPKRAAFVGADCVACLVGCFSKEPGYI